MAEWKTGDMITAERLNGTSNPFIIEQIWDEETEQYVYKSNVNSTVEHEPFTSMIYINDTGLPTPLYAIGGGFAYFRADPGSNPPLDVSVFISDANDRFMYHRSNYTGSLQFTNDD